MTFQRPAERKEKKNKKSCELRFLLVFAAQLFKMQITASIFQEREKLNWRPDKMAPGKTVHFFAQEETEKWQRKSFFFFCLFLCLCCCPFFLSRIHHNSVERNRIRNKREKPEQKVIGGIPKNNQGIHTQTEDRTFFFTSNYLQKVAMPLFCCLTWIIRIGQINS